MTAAGVPRLTLSFVILFCALCDNHNNPEGGRSCEVRETDPFYVDTFLTMH